MGNEFKGLASHSAEWFGDTRDHWWHRDTIARLGERMGAGALRRALDVGCGVGHWGRTLASVLPPDARVEGVDRESAWVEKAQEKAAAVGLGERFRYRRALADELPFEDGAFDLVTCQTVLIHVPDAAKVVREMARVTRPGGIVLLAEPNNAVWPILEATVLGVSPDDAASLLRFHAYCMLGKRLRGEGDENVGEILPGLLHDVGLEEIEIRMTDRAGPMIPPYATPAERALAEEMIDHDERDLWVWSYADTKIRFLAGGGPEPSFDALWGIAMDVRKRVAQAVKEKRYAASGGGLFYVGWGRKPSAG
ncbi:MAG: methyltransferase domain-containing protein [Polyangiaceae bacterium]